MLARFDGGAPALLERRVGAGRVLLWASTLDLRVERPAAEAGVPAVRAPRDAPPGRLRRAAPWLTVGQVLDPTWPASAAQRRRGCVLTPSGRRVPLDDEGARCWS